MLGRVPFRGEFESKLAFGTRTSLLVMTGLESNLAMHLDLPSLQEEACRVANRGLSTAEIRRYSVPAAERSNLCP